MKKIVQSIIMLSISVTAVQAGGSVSKLECPQQQGAKKECPLCKEMVNELIASQITKQLLCAACKYKLDEKAVYYLLKKDAPNQANEALNQANKSTLNNVGSSAYVKLCGGCCGR